MNQIQLSEAFKCLEDVDDKIFEDIKAPKLLKEGYVKRSEGKCLCSFDEENWEECSEEEFIELKDGGYEDLTEDEPEPKKVTESIKIDIRDDNQVSLARKLINMKKELEADTPEEVVDLKASTDEEAQETSHEGQIKLTCKTCGTSIFLKQDEVEFDLEDPETVNKELKECPYCHNSSGWEIEGKVIENDEKSEEEPGENDEIDSDLDELSDENLDDKPKLDKDEDELDADDESEEIDLSESIQHPSGLLLSNDGKNIIKRSAYRNISGHLDIPDGVEIIPIACFKDCDKITSIHLPDSVKVIKGKRFGDGAFAHCTSLKSIELSSSLKFIGDSTFFKCTSLESIDLPDSVEEIGYESFCDCENLRFIHLSSSLMTIGRGAFVGCTSLESIDIPESVDIIDDAAFAACDGLEKITCHTLEVYDILQEQQRLDRISQTVSIVLDNGEIDLSESIQDSSKLIRSKDGKKLLRRNAYQDISGHLDIPDGVEAIDKNAFKDCKKITSIHLPDSLKSIEESAFEGCIRLKSINFPSNLESIGFAAFYSCKKLDSISIPESVKNIGEFAFDYCESLKSVHISASAPIQEIGSGVFSGCESLESVNLPDSVKVIGDSAFARCKSLKSINIPNSLKKIEDSGFFNCESLKSINLPNSVEEIGEDAFGHCYSLDSVRLSNSLKKLGFVAFDMCESLQSIDLPESLQEIGGHVFSSCPNLKTITCHTTDIYDKLIEEQKDGIIIDKGVSIDLIASSDPLIDISEDIEISKFNEKRFDNMINQYLNEVYDNIDSYRTTDGTVDDESNKILIEGIIKFKSGKETDTKFLFEAKNIDVNGRIKFVGLNESFSKSKFAFSLQGAVINNQLFCTRLDYDYRPLITSLNESAKDSMIRVTGKSAYKRK